MTVCVIHAVLLSWVLFVEMEVSMSDTSSTDFQVNPVSTVAAESFQLNPLSGRSVRQQPNLYTHAQPEGYVSTMPYGDETMFMTTTSRHLDVSGLPAVDYTVDTDVGRNGGDVFAPAATPPPHGFSLAQLQERKHASLTVPVHQPMPVGSARDDDISRLDLSNVATLADPQEFDNMIVSLRTTAHVARGESLSPLQEPVATSPHTPQCNDMHMDDNVQVADTHL